MATNYVQPGDTVTLTAPRTVESGEGALVGSLFGIALGHITSGDEGEFATEGVWDLAAATSSRFTLGQKVYWDDASDYVADDSSTGNYLIGVAVVAKSGATATVRVRLDGVAV